MLGFRPKLKGPERGRAALGQTASKLGTHESVVARLAREVARPERGCCQVERRNSQAARAFLHHLSPKLHQRERQRAVEQPIAEVERDPRGAIARVTRFSARLREAILQVPEEVFEINRANFETAREGVKLRDSKRQHLVLASPRRIALGRRLLFWIRYNNRVNNPKTYRDRNPSP